MKNSNLTLKIACVLIVAALLVWVGIYAFQALNDPYRTVPVTAAEIRDTARVRGIVAREETVLYNVYSSVRIRLEEGGRVAAGGTVAQAYDSDEALLRAMHLAELRAEAEELTALLNAASAENTQQKDAEIQAGIRRLRRSVSARNFTEAESLSQTLRTQVFAASSSASDIRGRLQTVNGEIQELEQRADGGSDAIATPVAGLFSSTVDGWEDLSGADLDEIAPSALSALMAEERQTPDWALGKIVSGVRWYYAALVDAADADQLYGRDTVQLVLGQRYGEQLTMDVEWISSEEDGKRAVLLSCADHMSDVLSVRFQDAELLLSEASGLRIPRRGLHVDEQGRACVYVQTALLAEKKLVQVVRDFGDFYLVTSDALRAGDEIIISAKNLYEGKVVG
ncbi:MAG: hypothetical protein IKP17_02465 [Oscillospiraceae bacterium]|nr:hypothetical protein [Oscillospiraceae bacterium]MBR4691603.1 hypothetical protein [Oscillospiraceae bacterium]